jgi:hypothetical protein
VPSTFLAGLGNLKKDFDLKWAKEPSGKENYSLELTPREAGKLEAEQAQIEQTKERMQSDGQLTGKERQRLDNMQDRSSQRIYRQKHDAQKANQNPLILLGTSRIIEKRWPLLSGRPSLQRPVAQAVNTISFPTYSAETGPASRV